MITLHYLGVREGIKSTRKVVEAPDVELAGHIGCGAVWGDNIPGFTHPRVLIIASNVPAYEMIVDAVFPGNNVSIAFISR